MLWVLIRSASTCFSREIRLLSGYLCLSAAMADCYKQQGKDICSIALDMMLFFLSKSIEIFLISP